MFPLASDDVPGNATELAAAIEQELRKHVQLPARGKIVKIEDGGRYPDLWAVEIDMSGGEIEMDDLPPRPQPGKSRQSGPRVKSLHVIGHPIRWAQSALEFALIAEDAQFEYGRDRTTKQLILLIKQAGSGHVTIRITQRDLERMLREAASLAAQRQGVAIKDVRVTLSPIKGQPNAVAADIELTARKFLSAVIHISGEFAIDNDLNAVPSNLECSGEGMVGSIVCGLLKPHLQRIDGRPISLQALPLGSAKVREVKLTVTKSALEVWAQFA